MRESPVAVCILLYDFFSSLAVGETEPRRGASPSGAPKGGPCLALGCWDLHLGGPSRRLGLGWAYVCRVSPVWGASGARLLPASAVAFSAILLSPLAGYLTFAQRFDRKQRRNC